jgi:hypothetical protein
LERQAIQQQIRGLALIAVIVLVIVAVRYLLRLL